MDASRVSEVMIEYSREAILLTDSSKLNEKSLFEIGQLPRLFKVICNQEKPVDWYENAYEWITVDTLFGKIGENELTVS